MKKYAMIIAIALILILMVTMAGCFEGCNPGNEDPPTEEHVMEAYELALRALKENDWGGNKFLIYNRRGKESKNTWIYEDKVIQVQIDEHEKKLYYNGYMYLYDLQSENKTKRSDDNVKNAEEYKQMKTYYRERILEVLESDMDRRVDQLSDFIYKTYPDWVILEFNRKVLDENGYEDMGEIIIIETRMGETFNCIQIISKERDTAVTIRTASEDEWKAYLPSKLEEYEDIG